MKTMSYLATQAIIWIQTHEGSSSTFEKQVEYIKAKWGESVLRELQEFAKLW